MNNEKSKSDKKAKNADNLSINASLDDVIGLSVGRPLPEKKSKKRKVTPKKKTGK